MRLELGAQLPSAGLDMHFGATDTALTAAINNRHLLWTCARAMHALGFAYGDGKLVYGKEVFGQGATDKGFWA